MAAGTDGAGRRTRTGWSMATEPRRAQTVARREATRAITATSLVDSASMSGAVMGTAASSLAWCPSARSAGAPAICDDAQYIRFGVPPVLHARTHDRARLTPGLCQRPPRGLGIFSSLSL